MIVFVLLAFLLGALGGGAAVAMVAAGDRYDQEHAHAQWLKALERICGPT